MGRTNSDQITFEITDHQGNVRVTFVEDADTTLLTSYTDYYAFGSPMPGRTKSLNSHRFNYQGQELAVNQNWKNFELRMYNSDLGRFNSPDPYGQFHSPYVGMGNMGVNASDPSGGYAITSASFGGGPVPERISRWEMDQFYAFQMMSGANEADAASGMNQDGFDDPYYQSFEERNATRMAMNSELRGANSDMERDEIYAKYGEGKAFYSSEDFWSMGMGISASGQKNNLQEMYATAARLEYQKKLRDEARTTVLETENGQITLYRKGKGKWKVTGYVTNPGGVGKNITDIVQKEIAKLRKKQGESDEDIEAPRRGKLIMSKVTAKPNANNEVVVARLRIRNNLGETIGSKSTFTFVKGDAVLSFRSDYQVSLSVAAKARSAALPWSNESTKQKFKEWDSIDRFDYSFTLRFLFGQRAEF